MIKKGLKVMVLTGKNKKKEGEVIEIDRANNRAKIKEINMVKKHIKTTKEKKGGIVSKESFIHISNLKLIDEKSKSKKKIEASALLGEVLAKTAKEKKIDKVYFDRGSYKYHGRIKKFSESLRTNGLEF